MHRYLPHTDADRQSMLAVIGISCAEDLFADIPPALRLTSLDLPAAQSELAVSRTVRALAAQNASTAGYDCFMGGGVYDRFIPSVVPSLVSRQEFLTAYTPYQAEMSQGTLQATFEYQSMITALTGHDVANASLYDGASAVAEAMLMAGHATSRHRLVFAGAVDGQARAVCATYGQFNDFSLTHLPPQTNGTFDAQALQSACQDSVAAVVVQSPNAYGIVEDIAAAAAAAHTCGALLIVLTDPVACAVLEAPATLGADICVGEGQPLGLSLSFGGPGFGFMTATNALLRRMPGRIVGQTADANNNRGFVLTMQAREQHIRREKATSNICSNQALCTLAASVYLTAMGPDGLADVARQSAAKARYLHDALVATGHFAPLYDAPFLYEFALRYTGSDFAAWQRRMNDEGILPGIDLSQRDGLANGLLVAATEKYSRAQLDNYVAKAVSNA